MIIDLLTQLALEPLSLADLVDPDQWGVADVVQHVGHDADGGLTKKKRISVKYYLGPRGFNSALMF